MRRHGHCPATLLLMALFIAPAHAAPAAAAPSRAPMPAPVSTPEIAQGLDGDTLQKLLSAELAARRGQPALAARLYLQVSERHPDPALVERAIQTARAAGDIDLLTRAAERWRAISPEAIGPHRLLAAIAAQRGDWEAAMSALLEVQAAGGDAQLERFIETALEDGASLDALAAVLDEWLDAHPDSAHALITRALLRSVKSDFDAAQRDLERAAAVDNQLPALWLARSQLALDRDAPLQALEDARRGHQLAPDDRRFILAMAQSQLAMGDIDDAESQFNTLINAMPENLELRQALTRLYLQHAEFEAARRLLQPALDDSADAETLMLAARASAGMGDSEGAMALYQRVPADSDAFIASRAAGARLLLSQRDLDAALDWLQEQRRQHGDHNAELLGISLSLLDRSGHSERAAALLDEQIAAHPDDNRLRYMRALRALAREDIAAMERDMTTLLAREPNNVEALNAWGYTLVQYTERYREALELLERAHRLAPDSAAVTDSLGWALFHVGELERAVELLRQAWRNMPDEEIAAHLAEALWASGDAEAAQQLIANALTRFDQHPTLDELLGRYPLLAPQTPATAVEMPPSMSGPSTPSSDTPATSENTP
ncbi:tetratricopeptide repeat protein [Kushneria aurantia]|uniref:Tetratricopeptide repeat protein n=1 Tax=Kushneria aurantia TaxID=504092 RepID=A0ABV6G3N5_9GAMM|nr:tetratricopeptide repeat protein [Kushneria aurantia]